MNEGYLEGRSLGRLQLAGFVTVVAAIFIGVFAISDLESLAGYVVVLLASTAPMMLWIRRRGVDLPILPISALGYLVYYDVAILAGNTSHYTPGEILGAALTVALFLVAATLSWSGFAARRPPKSLEIDRELHVDLTLPRLINCAFLFGLAFEVGLKAGWGVWLGTWFGTFRSVALAAMSVGCFLFGTALGRGRLSAFDRYSGYALMATLIVMEISGLIMHNGILLMAASMIGYVISSKRLPWITITAAVLVVGVLHTAEGVEREIYWLPGQARQSAGLFEIPELMVDWVAAGVDQIDNPPVGRQNLAARASQLATLLLVQEQTPRNIAFLGGATYANFPQMLVPRFLLADKITSQANLALLSVRYGLQRPEDTGATQIAWNLVPEAYANFGYLGVAGAGLFFGFIVGVLTWLTSGAPPISLRGLAGLAALISLLDLEYDFSYLMLNLVQSLISIGLFYVGIRALEFFLGKKVLEQGSPGFTSARAARSGH